MCRIVAMAKCECRTAKVRKSCNENVCACISIRMYECITSLDCVSAYHLRDLAARMPKVDRSHLSMSADGACWPENCSVALTLPAGCRRCTRNHRYQNETLQCRNVGARSCAARCQHTHYKQHTHNPVAHYHLTLAHLVAEHINLIGGGNNKQTVVIRWVREFISPFHTRCGTESFRSTHDRVSETRRLTNKSVTLLHGILAYMTFGVLAAAHVRHRSLRRLSSHRHARLPQGNFCARKEVTHMSMSMLCSVW